MKLVRLFVVCSAAAMLPAAMAQKWEFGVGAGGGFYSSQDVKLGSDSAAAKLNNFSYSQLINGLKKAGIELDRKILSDIAIQDAPGFTRLVEQAKAALEAEKAAK